MVGKIYDTQHYQLAAFSSPLLGTLTMFTTSSDENIKVLYLNLIGKSNDYGVFWPFSVGC